MFLTPKQDRNRSKYLLKLLFALIYFLPGGKTIYSQSIPVSNLTICGTSGLDGTTNISGSINSYYPSPTNTIVAAGAKSLVLDSVPGVDQYGNNFGTVSISAGDLLLIIQVQDASINYSNSINYGANNPIDGPDGLGATGFTSLGNCGKYEYILATNTVPLTGGILNFKGSGLSGGLVYSYSNVDATAMKGKSTFQIIRVPQYSNLKLISNISPPPFNGKAGGIIAFEVSGTMDFNGYTVDVSARGYRGGYSPIKVSVADISDLYVTVESDPRAAGKGEGMAGTPRFVWDGFNAIDNILEGLPGGSCARGAPANAGGGGNDSNAGGAGGGNGNFGGNGGWGYEPIGGTNPAGGRPGSPSFIGPVPDITRLIMGGGGGGGHANDALTGVKGGVGGGIIIVHAGTITGSGALLSNGGNGAPGVYGLHPDGSGGGGAGGTVLIKVLNPSPSASLTINAQGGSGGNTEHDGPSDGVMPHGPGGGGSGGIVYYNLIAGAVNTQVMGGPNGLTQNGAGISHYAGPGLIGLSIPFTLDTIPNYLLGGGQTCFPELVTQMKIQNYGQSHPNGDSVIYIIKIFNSANSGNAGGVQSVTNLPQGFSYKSAKVVYTGSAGGPIQISNLGTANSPKFGNFNISPGDTVIIKLTAIIGCIGSGIFNSSSEAVYLDPTRDFTNPQRLITPQTNSFGGFNTVYNQSVYGSVLGNNYDGNTSTQEDALVISALPVILPPTLVNNPYFSCLGSSASLKIAKPLPGYTYYWYSSLTSTTPIDSGTNFTIPIALLDTAYYVGSVANGVCFSNGRTKAQVIINPIPTVQSDSTQICPGKSASLLAKSKDPAAIFQWYTSPNGGQPIFQGNPFLTPPLTNNTIYYIQVMDSITGCINLTRASFSIKTQTNLMPPDVSVRDSTSSSITFSWNQVPGAIAYKVSLDGGKTFKDPSSGANGLTDIETGLEYGQSLTLLVEAIGPSPCFLVSLSNPVTGVTINPNQNIIYIANTFTPNGDGINDEVSVHSLGIASMVFQVFSQWGELLFTSSQLNQGWDGYYKGSPEPAGVYIYYLKANMKNGSIVAKKGTITLLR